MVSSFHLTRSARLGLALLGRTQTKVQISKFRSLLKSIPFVRQKVDINIPGAHSTSRIAPTRSGSATCTNEQFTW